MKKGLKKARVEEIFEGKTYLHLVIWDRFCEKIHASGLKLVRSLIEDFDLAMPMLRPIGRKPNAYRDSMKKDFIKPVPNSISVDIPSAPILAGDYSGHCELWVQVADLINHNLLKSLKSFSDAQRSNFAVFLNHKNPTWAPLGESLQKCQYAVARDGLGTKILCDIGEEQLPAFLKLIWYGSTIAIAGWISNQSGNALVIDPTKQKGILREMMAKIFSDLDPKEYGISCSYNLVDPSSFGVSHMAAFALNALMPVTHFHQMEQYFGNPTITHPYSYPNREEYLKAFCS